MTQATEKTLKSYKSKIKFGTKKELPAIPGMNINGVIKQYKIPAIAWGWSGSLIGVETKKQYIFWRDFGTHLEFKGLLNK